jgi:hypothetical protein
MPQYFFPCFNPSAWVFKFKSNIKVILVTFFDDEGIVHREFVPTGTTVTAAFYMDVLMHLR